jgi:hypothetical protein
LTACSTDGALKVPLAPIAPPAPPVIVKVPVPTPLPAAMTEPCAKPSRRPIATDVDLLTAADAFKVWGACNAAKLQAISAAQPAPAP